MPGSLDRIPKFRDQFRVEILGPELMFLIGERQCFALRGSRNVRVAEMIDGRRSKSHIMQRLCDEFPEPQVLYTISYFRERGYLETAEESPQISTKSQKSVVAGGFMPPLTRCPEAGRKAGINPASTTRNLDRVVHGESGADELNAFLAKVSAELSVNAGITLVTTDDYLNPELLRCDAERWMLLKPTGVPLVGPLFDGDDGPCPECLAFWIRKNRPVEEFVRRCRGLPYVPLPQPIDPAAFRAACAVAVEQITAPDSRLRNHIIAFQPDTLRTDMHRITRRPQCPACGNPRQMQEQAIRPIELRAIAKHESDGGSRRSAPEETFERLRHLISPVTGAVAYLHPMPKRHTDLRCVYASGYLLCPRDMIEGNPFDKIAAGKGATPQQAKTSALCEALERYSAVYQGDEVTVRGSMAGLDLDCIHFNDLQLFGEQQYRDRDTINASTTDRRRQIPLPFSEDTAIDWTPAWSLSRKRHRYVPLTYCFNEAPPESGSAYGIHNPNGAAAGTCIEEAILQGLFELIERDAIAIWWYNALNRPGIDLSGFKDPYFDALCDDYDRMGWDLWALDLTHDLGIPVCAALAHGRTEDRWSIGFGCHLSAHVAVQRALTEVNQLFDEKGEAPAPWDRSRLAETTFLMPAAGKKRMAGDLPNLGRKYLDEDINLCISRLEAADLEVLVVDKTRADLGLCVVQVIVPGLRHFWPRFGPGRLYDVPRQLEWVKHNLAPIPANPVPLFL